MQTFHLHYRKYFSEILTYFFTPELFKIDNLNCAKINLNTSYLVWKESFLYIAVPYISHSDVFAAAYPACDNKRSMVFHPFGCQEKQDKHYAWLQEDVCASYLDVSWIFQIEFDNQ